MKKLIFLAACVAMSASLALAAGGDSGSAIPFANLSAASGATKYSTAIAMRGYNTKTLHLSGVTLTSSPTSITFKNMSGTVTAQCAPSADGPWTGCGRWQDGTGSAVSMTTNSNMSWKDSSAYVRLKWVAGTIGGKLKAWLNWNEY